MSHLKLYLFLRFINHYNCCYSLFCSKINEKNEGFCSRNKLLFWTKGKFNLQLILKLSYWNGRIMFLKFNSHAVVGRFHNYIFTWRWLWSMTAKTIWHIRVLFQRPHQQLNNKRIVWCSEYQISLNGTFLLSVKGFYRTWLYNSEEETTTPYVT